jgi:hypothetical protein
MQSLVKYSKEKCVKIKYMKDRNACENGRADTLMEVVRPLSVF